MSLYTLLNNAPANGMTAVKNKPFIGGYGMIQKVEHTDPSENLHPLTKRTVTMLHYTAWQSDRNQ